jgi:CHAT domain-containing protein
MKLKLFHFAFLNHEMKILISMKYFFTALLLFCVFGIHAQDQNLDQAGVRLSAQERERLQLILDKPIDQSSLFSSRVVLHRDKDLAAFKLGDVVRREENLRAWAAIDPQDGKWGLFGFLMDTQNRAEGYRLGRELVNEHKWPPNRVRLRIQLARNYMDDSNLKESAKLMAEAENILRSDVKNMPRQGNTTFWILRAEVEFYIAKAILNTRMGRWQDGIEDAKSAVVKSVDLSKQMSMAPTENAKQWSYGTMLHAYGTLGQQQIFAGLYAEAEWTLRDAYQRTKTYGMPETSMQGFYNRVADYYMAVGQFDEAYKFAVMSEKIVLDQGYQMGSPMWLWARMRFNSALIGSDKWQEALKSFDLVDQETARLGRAPRGAQSQSLLRGYVYIRNGQVDKALSVLQANMNWHVNNFGEDHYFTSVNRGVLAVALWKNGRAAEARQGFDRAVRGLTAPESLTGDYVETAIQQKMSRFILQSYLQLVAQTADKDPKDAELIFQIAEQLNVSKVQQALAEAAVRSGVSEPGLSSIIRKEQDAKNEITTLTNYISGQGTEEDKRRNPQIMTQMRERLREIEKERREYKIQIQKTYPEYFQLIQPKPPSTQDIAKQLQPDELFLAITPLEDKTYVWAINARGEVKFQISNLSEADLKRLVAQTRKTLDVAELGARAPPFDVRSAHQIYKEILAPFGDELKLSKHLIVATSGQLAQLPFAVLPRTADTKVVAWLVQDIAISHVPTANGWLALKRLSKQPAAPQPLLAWGDPAFDADAISNTAAKDNVVRSMAVTRSLEAGQRNIMDAANYVAYSKIPPLPETRDEVLRLATILKADPQQDLIMGHEATRSSVLKQSASGNMAKKQVVVFATHGLLAGDLPQLNQPALAMAATKDAKESPLLTLEDVLGLRLNADWVVLSACNTAGADGKAEEALSGLARGFFYAGSRSLLVTHWAVESISAVNLTTKTFAAYKDNTQIRRAEALRQAMLDTMKMPNFSHPTYWAPYALVGEGGR